MNRIDFGKVFCLLLIITAGFLGTRCATQKEEHVHGEMAPVKTFPKGYVHPLTEINFDKALMENRGLKILEENATTVHDYYRGGIQEKAEGEKLFSEGRLEEAQSHLEKSNRFFLVVLRYLPEDEAYKNIYGDHTVIFLPNLLMADNYLKLITLFKKMGRDDKVNKAQGHGEYYLSESLKAVKTEWAYQIRKGFEKEFPKK